MNAKDCFASMQYIDSAVLSLNIKNDYIFFDVEDDTELTLDVDYNVNEIEKCDKGYIATLTLKIDWNASCPENNASMNLITQGAFLFEIEGDVDEDEIRKGITEKLSLNGVSTMYSICRGKITSIFSQMCSGRTLNLPMINVIALYEKKQNESKEEKPED